MIVGAVMTGLGLAVGGYAVYVRKDTQVMIDMQTTPAGKVTSPGYYEVKGRVVCENPLEVEGLRKPAVYVRYKLEEEIETVRENSEGERETTTRWETRVNEVKTVPFFIKDSSGQVQVMADGATIEGHHDSKTMRGSRNDGAALGRAFMGAVGLGAFSGSDKRVKNRRESTTSIYVNDRLYTLGNATHFGGGMALSRGGEGEFLLSTRSEEERTAVGTTKFQGAAILSAVLVFGGIMCMALGVGT